MLLARPSRKSTSRCAGARKRPPPTRNAACSICRCSATPASGPSAAGPKSAAATVTTRPAFANGESRRDRLMPLTTTPSASVAAGHDPAARAHAEAVDAAIARRWRSARRTRPAAWGGRRPRRTGARRSDAADARCARRRRSACARARGPSAAAHVVDRPRRVTDGQHDDVGGHLVAAREADRAHAPVARAQTGDRRFEPVRRRPAARGARAAPCSTRGKRFDPTCGRASTAMSAGAPKRTRSAMHVGDAARDPSRACRACRPRTSLRRPRRSSSSSSASSSPRVSSARSRRRGCTGLPCSTMVTGTPASASRSAAHEPAGPGADDDDARRRAARPASVGAARRGARRAGGPAPRPGARPARASAARAARPLRASSDRRSDAQLARLAARPAERALQRAVRADRRPRRAARTDRSVSGIVEALQASRAGTEADAPARVQAVATAGRELAARARAVLVDRAGVAGAAPGRRRAAPRSAAPRGGSRSACRGARSARGSCQTTGSRIDTVTE